MCEQVSILWADYEPAWQRRRYGAGVVQDVGLWRALFCVQRQCAAQHSTWGGCLTQVMSTGRSSSPGNTLPAQPPFRREATEATSRQPALVATAGHGRSSSSNGRGSSQAGSGRHRDQGSNSSLASTRVTLLMCSHTRGLHQRNDEFGLDVLIHVTTCN